MKVKSKDFRIIAGKRVELDKWPTQVKPIYKSKKKYQKTQLSTAVTLCIQ